jgi:hypothetical protein
VQMTQSRDRLKTLPNISGHQSAARAEPERAWQMSTALSRLSFRSP